MPQRLRRNLLEIKICVILKFNKNILRLKLTDNTWSTALETISTPKTKEESLEALTIVWHTTRRNNAN